MDADHVRIQAIDPWRKDQVEVEFPESPSPPTLELVGRKKPGISRQVRAWNTRHAMPDDLRKVHILDGGAVKVDFVIFRQALDLLCQAAFRAVAFVQERRNHSDYGFSIFDRRSVRLTDCRFSTG